MHLIWKVDVLLNHFKTTISERIPAITKVYSRLSDILQVTKVSSDPSLLLPSLQAYLLTLQKEPKELNSKLKKYLEHLLPSVTLEIASELSSLLTDLPEFSQNQIPAFSCAIFILALEANAMKPIPELQIIAEKLGSRLGGSGAGASKWAVTARYNAILLVLLEWKREQPLFGPPIPSNARKAPRIEVSRSLRDLVNFRTQDLARARERAPTPLPSPIIYEQLLVEHEIFEKSVPRKRPLDEAMAASSSKKHTSEEMRRNEQDILATYPRPSNISASSWLRSLSRAERLLESDSTPQQSRLELLQAKCRLEGRELYDDELFENGEMESLFRSEQEVALLRKANAWEDLPGELSEPDACTRRGAPHVNSWKDSADYRQPHAGEDVEVVGEWRPLSPTLLSAGYLEEAFEDL